MAKRKKGTTLPRLTVLAYSRRDLLAFVSAVEALRHLVEDLRAEVATLKAKRARPVPVPVPAQEGGLYQ